MSSPDIEDQEAYLKYKDQLTQEVTQTYAGLKYSILETNDREKLREISLTLAKSAYEQCLVNYDTAVAMLTIKRKYNIALSLIGLLAVVGILSNIVTALIVWQFLR
jgi:hypothetical protein